MSATITNWNAKVSVELVVEDGTTFLDTDSDTYELRSVQSIDPQFDSRIEPQHSINNENIGYLVRPAELVINLGVLASVSIPVDASGALLEAKKYSDAEIVLWLQMNKKEFTMTISDSAGTGKFVTLTFKRCRVNQGRPGTFTPDGQPISNWTLRALEWDDPWA